MTKKRIADLLKEEVKKSNEAAEAPVEDVSQETQTSSDTPKKAATGTGRTRKRTSKASTTSKAPTGKASNTVALEKQIADLEGALKQAQEQIVELQDDLKTHQARIFELKDDLDAAQKATVEKTDALTKATEELETAKDTIRQITAQKEETPEPEATPPKVIHGADLATNRNTLSLRNRPSGYKAIPEYAIQRGEQNSMLSDDDIGWVD
ncbi:hypothetical protein N836_34910 [Leptolyngbya sp. Heron Island J]|uniref:hypothetical protein n=1 Tax=Leptolyngbya sp. Heron Island J TaxID=1385935 RepID=UPI0003B99E71|nr:hypothetical protein [Leptolyngbya sp. Heron Island J]ESA37816.1 hypothetical protein N836_34910 [Leptolyngbya sp. Heron Island J]